MDRNKLVELRWLEISGLNLYCSTVEGKLAVPWITARVVQKLNAQEIRISTVEQTEAKNPCVKLRDWEVSHEVQQTIKVADFDDLKMWGIKQKTESLRKVYYYDLFINIIIIIFLLVSSPRKEVLNSVHHTPISSVKYHFQYFPLSTEKTLFQSSKCQLAVRPCRTKSWT